MKDTSTTIMIYFATCTTLAVTSHNGADFARIFPDFTALLSLEMNFCDNFQAINYLSKCKPSLECCSNTSLHITSDFFLCIQNTVHDNSMLAIVDKNLQKRKH